MKKYSMKMDRNGESMDMDQKPLSAEVVIGDNMKTAVNPGFNTSQQKTPGAIAQQPVGSSL